jgi:hypothetical protein
MWNIGLPNFILAFRDKINSLELGCDLNALRFSLRRLGRRNEILCVGD